MPIPSPDAVKALRHVQGGSPGAKIVYGLSGVPHRFGRSPAEPVHRVCCTRKFRGTEYRPFVKKSLDMKKVEFAVRNVIHGEPVKNKDALRNPEALDFYADLPKLSPD